MQHDYEQTIRRALEAIPERFRHELKNVAIIVEDAIGPDCDCVNPDCDHEQLLGLYDGVPLIDREGDSTGLLPDVITLFAKSIENEAREGSLSIEQVIRETVWHEVAHFFGFDEDRAEALEKKWELNYLQPMTDEK
ncbi:MAG: metallopeptidase family protein [Patescibacteria group bacterium]